MVLCMMENMMHWTSVKNEMHAKNAICAMNETYEKNVTCGQRTAVVQ